jgi:hypothetical protein
MSDWMVTFGVLEGESVGRRCDATLLLASCAQITNTKYNMYIRRRLDQRPERVEWNRTQRTK